MRIEGRKDDVQVGGAQGIVEAVWAFNLGIRCSVEKYWSSVDCG
jgi:hypothetical protein